MNTLRLVSWSCGLALLASGAGSLAQPPALDAVRVSVGGQRMPVVAAQRHGLFAKYGIEVDRPRLPAGGSDSVRAALAAGDVEIVHSIVDNAVAMVELAGADVVIVMGGAGSPYELIVQPGHTAVEDLRGKTLIVDAPHTALALQMKKILMLHGLSPERDYRFETGTTGAQRLVKMREDRTYAAAMLGPPTSIVARREGFVSLGSSATLIGRLQGTAAYVRRQWAREHADLLERYIAATVEAQRWLMAPANRQSVIELIADDSEVPPDVAAQTYELAMAPGGWDTDMQFDVEGFNNLLRLRAEVEDTWDGRPPAPATYYDSSYYRRALARLE